MRNAKLWSVLLASVLLCASVIGSLFIGADAAPYELSVGEGGDYATVAEALDAAAEADLSGYDNIQINILGEVAEPAPSNSLLFGQKTIWAADGEMIPIVITGEGTLSLAAGTVVNANDVTFKDLDLPISQVAVKLFAGSGTVTIDNCDIGTGTAYRLYADNNSAAAFEGWDEADYNARKDEDGHICTALNLKNGTFPTEDGSYLVAAVGSSTDFEAVIGSVTISANNTKTAVNWENCSTAFPYNRYGMNPVAESTVYLKNCTVTGYRAAGWASSSSVEIYTGDVVYKVEGGTYSSYGRVMNSCTLQADKAEDKAEGAANGDFTLILDNCQPVESFLTSGNNFIQASWGTTKFEGDFNLTYKNLHFSRTFFGHNSATLTVDGDYNLNIDGLETGAVYGMFAKLGGNVNQKVKNLNIINNSYKKIAFLECEVFGGDIVNEFTDCTIGYTNTSYYYFYLGTNINKNATGIKSMTNTLKNVDITTTNITFVCGSYKADVNGNITNSVDANCTFSGGYIGGNYNGSVNGNISNTIYGGVFKHSNDASNAQKHAAYTGGIYTNGDVTGKIYNHIKGGSFDKCKNGYSAFMGAHQTSSHKIEGGIESVIDGGEFAGYLFCGNRGHANISNSVAGAPAIKTTVNGGSFHGFWTNRGHVTGNVETTINGGTFDVYSSRYPYVLCGGGYRDDSLHLSGNTVIEINGGTFKNSVVAGFVNRDTEDDILAPGEAIMKIHGGTFEGGVFGNSYNGYGKKTYSAGKVIIDTTVADADPLVLLGEVGLAMDEAAGFAPEVYTVEVKTPATGSVIKIGADTNIVADSVEGKLTLLQTEGWLGHDYFTVPAPADILVEEEEGIYGIYDLSQSPEVILLKGGFKIGGTTLIFEDRVGIRVLLDPEMTSVYSKGFKYSVAKAGEAAFFEGTELEEWVDPATATIYDSFVISGIGLRDFGTDFTVEVHGAETLTFSVNSLATLAQSTWTGDWKTFAEAICNLNGVYSDAEGVHDEALYTLQSVAQTTEFSRDEAAVASGVINLMMSDAVGVKLALTLNDTYTAGTLTATLNDYEATSAVTVDGKNVTVSFYVKANAMTDAFTLKLMDGENEIFSLTTSVEKLANDLALATGNENQENAQALLYYIQKAAVVA
ncbi:MAG: hypothetical protein E7580_07935 [Ruminococcaceae bacterium]|nr:hypothetical protein [Oscillospiraceae bacterium]